MLQNYEVWVVIDPAVQAWSQVESTSIQGAAEAAAYNYDQRPDVDFALSKEGTLVQVFVRDPSDSSKAFGFEVSCSLNPFYEIVADTGRTKF